MSAVAACCCRASFKALPGAGRVASFSAWGPSQQIMSTEPGAGHTFLILLGDGFFPINVLAAVRPTYCATMLSSQPCKFLSGAGNWAMSLSNSPESSFSQRIS